MMRRLIFLCFTILLTSFPLLAQSTTLSGTVTDQAAQTWNNGSYSFTFRPNPAYPTGPYFWNGSPFPTAQTFSGLLSGSGTYSLSLPSNTSITPAGSQWTATICSLATVPCYIVNLTVTGATQTFNFNPPAVSISLINPPPGPMLAYADSEISSAQLGSEYYNVTIGAYRFCQAVTGQTCTSWATTGSGGGSSFYQVVESNSTPVPQEPHLNFAPPAILTDTSGVRTTVTYPPFTSAGPSHASGLVPDPGATVHNFPLCDTGAFSSTCQSATSLLPNPVAATNLSNGAFPFLIGGDTVLQGPNPAGIDIRAFGGRIGSPCDAPAGTPTVTISSGSNIAVLTGTTGSGGKQCFFNGDGIVIPLVGPAQSMSTPSAPTVTSSIAASFPRTGYVVNSPTGSTSGRCYKIVARDVGQGLTAASPEVCVTNGQPLGAPSTNISGGACTQSNNIVSCTTSSAHTLAVGAMINVGPTPGAGSWNIVRTVPDTTHFTYITSTDTRYGAPTTVTAAQVMQFNCNHLVLPAYTGAQWQYYIYAGTTGAETLIDVALPNINTGDSAQLTYDDFGAGTYSTQFPYFVPNTPPSSATNDSLVTTVASGGGTTTMTLAASAAATSACSSGGCLILQDNAPAMIAAATYAGTNGGPAYIPTTPSGGIFSTNSVVNFLTANLSVAGILNLNDTLEIGSKLYGAQNPSYLSESGTSFQISRHTQILGRGNPNVFLGGTPDVRDVQITSPNNGLGTILATGVTYNLQNDTFYGTGGMGIGFYDYRQFPSGGFGGVADHVSFLSDSGSPPYAPTYISMNDSQMQFSFMELSRRTMLWGGCQSHGFSLEVKTGGDDQGPIMPMYVFSREPNCGNTTSLGIKLKNITIDTANEPAVAHFVQPAGNQFNGPIEIDGGNLASVSGTAFPSMNVKNSPVACLGVATVPNAKCDNNGNGYSSLSQTVAITGPVPNPNLTQAVGSNLSGLITGQIANPTTAPTVTVGTTCSGFPPSGTYQYGYFWWDLIGGATQTSSLSAGVSLNGTTQCATITLPVSAPASAFYWTAFAGGTSPRSGQVFDNVHGLGSCAPEFTSIAFTSILDQNVNSCGSGPNSNSSSSTSITPAGLAGPLVSPSINLLANVAPSPASSGATLFNDPALLWPAFFENGAATKYQIPGVSGPITAGNTVCFANSTTAAVISCTGGAGNVNPALLNSFTYYSGAGTTNTLSGVNGAIGPNGVFQFFGSTPSGGAAGTPFQALPGIPGRTNSAATDTIVATDRVTRVEETNAGAVAVAIAGPGTTGFNSNYAVKIKSRGANSVVTITPGAGTCNGAATCQLTQGQVGVLSSSDNTNYFLDAHSPPITCGSGMTCTPSDYGLSLSTAAGGGTVTHTLGPLTSGQLVIGNGAADVTVGNLSGDVTTSGSTVATVVQVEGAAIPASSSAICTNSSSQLINCTNTGTGNNVLATSPTLSAPNLGTPTAINLSNATALPCSATPALTGDTTTSAGSCATTTAKINGTAFPTSTSLISSNSSAQPVAATGHNVSLTLQCADSSGSGTAQSCTTSPSFTPAAGDCMIYTTTTANTGTSLTINWNSLGAKSVAKWQSTTTLAANDILANKEVLMCYDGTNIETSTIGNVPSGGGGSSALSAITAATGNNTIANGNNFQTWNWALTSNTQNGITFGETTASSGTGDGIVGINTLSTTTAIPLNISHYSTSTTIPAINIGQAQAAISGTNVSSPAFAICGQYFNVSALQDCFIEQNVVGAGAGPTNTLTWTHTGSSHAMQFESMLFASGKLSSTAAGSGITILSGQDANNPAGTLGLLTVRGPDISGGASASNVAGSWLARAGNNAGTSASSSAGSMELLTGASTGATQGLQGLFIQAFTYVKGTTVTQWNVEVSSGAAMTVQDSGASTASWLCIAEVVNTNTVQCVDSGQVPVNSSNTATIGHTFCTSVTGGDGADSGGTAACTLGTEIGIVIATSGTFKYPDGTSFTASTTLPLIQIARD